MLSISGARQPRTLLPTIEPELLWSSPFDFPERQRRETSSTLTLVECETTIKYNDNNV